MSVAVNAVVAGLAVFVVVAGSIWYLTVDRQRDRIQVTDLHHAWSGTSGSAERISVDATFRNRYGVEARLHGWHYELQVQGIRVAAAESLAAATVRPNAFYESHIDLDLPNDFVGPWVRSHLTGGEKTPAKFVGEAYFQVSNKNLTVEFGTQVEWTTDLRDALASIHNCPQAPPNPCIESTQASWGTEGDATVLRLLMRVQNPNDDPLSLGARSAELVWGGVPVGRSDADHDETVAPHGASDVEFRLFLAQGLLVDWWKGHIQRCESSPTALRLVLPYTVETPPPPTPTNTTSPTPSSSTPSSSSPSPSSTPPSETPSQTTNQSGKPKGTHTPLMGPPTLPVQGVWIFDAVLELEPVSGEAGRVAWEFPGPAFQSELVCQPG